MYPSIHPPIHPSIYTHLYPSIHLSISTHFYLLYISIHLCLSLYVQVPGKMGYEDFVWFILSEEDKTTETALDYWFRCE